MKMLKITMLLVIISFFGCTGNKIKQDRVKKVKIQEVVQSSNLFLD